MLTVQPGDLSREFHGIAMAPAGPEAALAAVVAQMRTAARELHDHGALAAPIAVAFDIDQLPADTISIEIDDRACGARGERTVEVVAIGDAGHIGERPAPVQRLDQRHDGRLAFAAHDEIEGIGRGQYVVPMVGRKHTAIDHQRPRRAYLDHPGDPQRGRMCRRRTGMADQDAVGIAAQRVVNQRRKRHWPEFGIDEPHLMACVEQRTAERQKAERRQMVVRHAAADGGVRRVDQHDFHGGPFAVAIRWS